jgi:hypothetical protein
MVGGFESCRDGSESLDANGRSDFPGKFPTAFPVEFATAFPVKFKPFHGTRNEKFRQTGG